MAHYSDEGCDGMELLDLLFDQTDGILRHEELGRHGNQLWPITAHGTQRPTDGSDELLNVLLRGGDCVSESSLWPPSPSDSGISEDPHSDQMDSPPPSDRLPLEPQSLSVPQHTSPSLVAAEPDFSIDLDGWQSGAFRDGTRAVRFAADVHRTRKSPGTPLTVKDLLLSGTADLVLQPSQPPFQELILNEDEKKLLAKEGVTLPGQLPLTKFEERILKKIRRKIRNKQSAQESRKKKKEYIDGLESRMAACSAQNQELQRKVFQLEKRHTSLMEQLRKLQALVMSGSTKTAQMGTCLLVLVLSFSLFLFPSLKPFSDSSVSQEGDFTPVRVQSRSLHNIQSSRVLRVLNHPYSGREEPKSVSPFSGNEGVEEMTSLLKKLQGGHGFSRLEPIAHNNSLEERGHHRGDPITGHVTTVTLTPRYGTPLSPHGDDM